MMVVVVEEQSVAATEYVTTLLSQYLVQKSVMVGEKFNQLPRNVHAVLMLSSNVVVVGGLDNKPIKTVETG